MKHSNLWEVKPSHWAISAPINCLKPFWATNNNSTKVKLIVLFTFAAFFVKGQTCTSADKDLSIYQFSTTVTELPSTSAWDYQIDLELDSAGNDVHLLRGYQIDLAIGDLSQLSMEAYVSGDWSGTWCIAGAEYAADAWLSPQRDTLHVQLDLSNCATNDGKGKIATVYLNDATGTIRADALIKSGGGIILIDNINGRVRPQVENPSEEIRVFPNPVSTTLNLDPGTQPVEQIKLFDTRGHLIRVWKAPNQLQSVSVEGFQPGIYLVIFELADGKQLVQKVLVSPN